MLSLPDIENKIICADALDILPELPAGAVDVIITDPVWPGAKADLPGKYEAPEIFARAAQEFPRIAGRLVVHLGQTTDPRLLNFIPRTLPFVQVCWLRWIPPRYRGPILLTADVAYVFGHTRLPADGSRVFGAEVNSRYQNGKINDAMSDPDCPHPTPRSITHVAWLVQRFSRPGDLILDPFCGSGTTCLAAKLAGRRFCGIDKDKSFADYSLERVSQPDLFTTDEPQADPAVQSEIFKPEETVE